MLRFVLSCFASIDTLRRPVTDINIFLTCISDHATSADDHRFYRLVMLFSKLSAQVLRRVIKQYCDVHGLTFRDVLDFYKHELFHYWHGATAGCCKCKSRRFSRVLLGQTVVYNVHWHLCQSPCHSCPLGDTMPRDVQRFTVLALGLMSVYVTYLCFLTNYKYNRGK